MLYFAISPSAINPHCGARPASALACLPQVGIQLGAGAISFSATVCPPQSFVKKRRSCPAGENSGLVGNIKKKKKGQERERPGEEDGGWVGTKTKGVEKNPPELLIGGGASEASDGRQH